MHIVTFYSFKGGVGRTMALTNVAYELARSGKRVLIVDFDLEAPGLDTIQASPTRGSTPGIVDFVHAYMESGEAPDVRDFIYPVNEKSAFTGKLWVMPAGRPDDNYARRLSEIDWARLYREQEGFLLFEDLKAQWADLLAPDYVLIDSRTGHTDVGGICTRQLPDAVTVLFIPNEQNLRGLTKVIRDIRSEAQSPRNKRIDLQFVMSNYPDLDDENDILREKLREFRKVLNIPSRELLSIRRFDSLDLLTQIVFTKTRRKSRLAREYRQLTAKLRSLNPSDSEGALSFVRELSRGPLALEPRQLEERIEEIRAANLHNGEVLAALAQIRVNQGRAGEALALLTEARRTGFESGELYLNIAIAHQVMGELQEAARAASRVFDAPGTDFFELQRAVEVIRGGGIDDFVDSIGTSLAVTTLPDHLQLWLASSLSASKPELRAAKRILRALQSTRPDFLTSSPGGRHTLVLVLIGLGEFQEAINVIDAVHPPSAQLSVEEAFNYAMASWGLQGRPDRAQFARVPSDTTRHVGDGSPNFHQCMAIVRWVLDDIEGARTHLSRSRIGIATRSVPEFSCWRYLRVSGDVFLSDLDRIEKLFAGHHESPLFITASESVAPTGRHEG
jgi:MinD-like ATPase involved in chromosome partitioning or flagellar assembly